jgi:hypothetical protein
MCGVPSALRVRAQAHVLDAHTEQARHLGAQLPVRRWRILARRARTPQVRLQSAIAEPLAQREDRRARVVLGI